MCKVDGCGPAAKITRDMCSMHYMQWKRRNPSAVRPVIRHGSMFDRVIARSELVGSCWVYQGAAKNKYGYAQIAKTTAGVMVRRPVYRVVWEGLVGPCPEGLVPDHLCRAPRCVNPDHLDWVTQRENARRSYSPAAIAARRRREIENDWEVDAS